MKKILVLYAFLYIDPADISITIYMAFFTKSLSKHNDNDKREVYSKNVGEMSTSAVSTELCSDPLFKRNDLLMLSNLILKHTL